MTAPARAESPAGPRRHGDRARRDPGRSASSTRLLELVFDRDGAEWAVPILRGVESVAGPARIGVVLSELGGARRAGQEWFDDVRRRRPLGLVVVASDGHLCRSDRLQRLSIPFVVVDTAGDSPPVVPAVGSTNWYGGLVATRHLLGLGHRRIAVITGPADLLGSRARLGGYRTALDGAGIAVDPRLIRHGDLLLDSGHRHGRDLLSRHRPATAVVACSDLQAVGVLRAAHELGLRVPQDLSVVGHDDLPVSAWTTPALTTVRRPLHEMAATATRMVLDLVAGVVPANVRMELTTDLVVRESTSSPREASGASWCAR